MAGLFLVHTARLFAQASDQPGQSAERVFSEAPNVFFEEYFTSASVAPDGRLAVYSGAFGGFRMLDLQRGSVVPTPSWPGLTAIMGATFSGHGHLVLLGAKGEKTGWFTREGSGLKLLPIPPDATARWSPSGERVAFVRASVADSLFAGPLGQAKAYPARGRVTGLDWLAGDSALLVLALEPDGSSTLSRLDLRTGRPTIVAKDLDAPPLTSPIAVSPSGQSVFVALAGAGPPIPAMRHQPHAERRLRIYQVDLATGNRRPVTPRTGVGEAFAPCVAGGQLYWTYASTDISVVVVPIGGGAARKVVSGAHDPSWRPDGREIGFSYGDWRWADWAINWDGGGIEVDADGRPQGHLRPIVTGYHEDFQPVWSPNGRWIAFHSHRSALPVASYASPGGSDDIWLKSASSPARDSSEIRLTDFGWEVGPALWSHDGQRLVFGSQKKGGSWGVFRPYFVAIDTVTGHPIRHGELPLPPGVPSATGAAWSPVNDDLLLEQDLGSGRHALWIAPAERGRPRKLVEYVMRTFGGWAWTSDGRGVVYAAAAPDHNQLFAVSAEGGDARQLTHDDANLLTPAVSPDGRLIAATRVTHRKEVWREPAP